MDIEFHYYMTYLIAARAGFSARDALTIAHSAQGVDDNHIPLRLTDVKGQVYENRISQTMDILRPHEDSLIYPIFHFIPGDMNAPGAARLDGRRDPWVTTPDSSLANQMLDAALASGDPYRIGVSAHGYVDTWAHQNFLGRRDSFNQFKTGLLAEVLGEIMAVGHAHAKHNPDWPALTWDDTRLVTPRVINRERFLDAAAHLFGKFARHVNPAITDSEVARLGQLLVADLDADIGPDDNDNALVDERRARYLARSLGADYGASVLPPYIEGQWFAEAIEEDRKEVEANASRITSSLLDDVRKFAGDVFADSHRQVVRWRDGRPEIYRTYNWYRFQEAVKAHLDECAQMLVAAGLLTATQ